MEIEAVVNYGEDFAFYQVRAERDGIYQAQLLRFYGSPESAPPTEITLVRGIRKWVGSCSIPQLVNDLGSVIETLLPQDANLLHRKRDETTSPES